MNRHWEGMCLDIFWSDKGYKIFYGHCCPTFFDVSQIDRSKLREGIFGLTQQFILAMGHVRASAGDLVVHGAFMACVCVRCQTPFSSRHESGQSLFLSTGKHQAVGQPPRVSFSAQPGQRSDRPNLSPYKKISIFQCPFASIRTMPSEACSSLGKRRIDRSTSKRSS